VSALDADGDALAQRTSVRTLRAVDDRSSMVRYSSGWRRSPVRSALGSGTRSTTRAGSRARFTFRGDQVALVATRGPGQGRIRILIDGRKVRDVNLRAASTNRRSIVFARGLTNGRHTLEVRVIRGPDGRSGRVDIDGFLYTSR
jgi:hypothetical protein